MSFAIYSDFCDQGAEPKRWCALAARAGFEYLHWGHEFASSHIYTAKELRELGRFLNASALSVVDIHAAVQADGDWTSSDDVCRRKGVDLVCNALRMRNAWSATGAVVVHPVYRDSRKDTPGPVDQITAMYRSLDELLPQFERAGARLAMENLPGDTGEVMDETLRRYDTPVLGICFDSGHANMLASIGGFVQIERHANRLYATHLHDNDGVSDLHLPPFHGIMDWQRVVNIIRSSSYHEPLSFEFSLRNTPFHQAGISDFNLPEETIMEFLEDAYERCARVEKLFLEQQQ